MGRRGIATTLAAIALAAAPAAAAALPSGKSYAPGKGKAYHGVSDTGDVGDFFTFADQVGAHPAMLQEFFHWRVPLTTGAFERWAAADTRGVLSLSTLAGSGEEVITPQQIAEGRDDRYILRLARTIAEAGQTVYIRLMAEMNGHWNPYSAYNVDGSERRGGHSTRWFKRAWRRFTLIVRGGPRREINERLVRMGMPRILRARSQDDPVYAGGPDGIPLPVPAQLPRPRVSMMWVPQSFGSPNIRGNQPPDYWPGGRYVDWVGIDIYSKFAGAFDEGRALLSPLPALAVRDRRVRAVGQRLLRRLHPLPVRLGRGQQPGEDAPLLPRRHPGQRLQRPVLPGSPGGPRDRPGGPPVARVRAGRAGDPRPPAAR